MNAPKLFILIAAFLIMLVEIDAQNPNSNGKQMPKKRKREYKELDECHRPLPSNQRVKTFSSLVENPQFSGLTHVLKCPIVSKELEKELLCGLDPNFSLSDFLFSSGFIDNPYPASVKSAPKKISITCVSVVVKNMFVNVRTKNLWHGKCFMSSPNQIGYFLPQSDVSIKYSENSTDFNMKNAGQDLYSFKMPSLEQASTTDQLDHSQILSMTALNIFEDFFSNRSVSDFCPAKPLSTGILNMKLGVKKVRYYKLRNLDGLRIHPDFSKTFGLKNPINKEALDESRCVASIFKSKFMESQFAVSVLDNVSVPPKNSDRPLSNMFHFPRPYAKMSDADIRNLTLHQDQSCGRYGFNNEILKVKHCEKPCSTEL